MNEQIEFVYAFFIPGFVIIKKGEIVEARLQEVFDDANKEVFDDANSQAYPRPTQEDFDFKKDLSSWIIQVNIKQSKIFK